MIFPRFWQLLGACGLKICNFPVMWAKNRGFRYFSRRECGVYFKFGLTRSINSRKSPINFENFLAGGGKNAPYAPSAYGPELSSTQTWRAKGLCKSEYGNYSISTENTLFNFSLAHTKNFCGLQSFIEELDIVHSSQYALFFFKMLICGCENVWICQAWPAIVARLNRWAETK